MLDGQEIATLQVLGANSLKSFSPNEPSAVSDRLFTVTSKRHAVASHLQRTGKLVWLAKAEPYVIAAGSARPMVRLVVANRDGLDLTGPANTKRITATMLTRRDPALRARP